MTFYAGMMLGFSGGCLVSAVVYMFLLISASRGKKETDTRLYNYWDASMENQLSQIEVLSQISEAIKK